MTAQETADEVRSLARLAFGELSDGAAGLYGFHPRIAGARSARPGRLECRRGCSTTRSPSACTTGSPAPSA